MKFKVLIPIMVLLILVPITLSCTIDYNSNEEVIILDVIAPEGLGLDCNLTIYQQNLTLNQSGLMTRYGLAYNYSAGMLDNGIYSGYIDCRNATDTFYGECKWEVVRDKDKMIATILGFIAIIIFYIFMGLVSRRSFAIKFFCFAIALVELVFMFGILFIDEAGGSLVGLLRINFWIMVLLGLGIGFISIYDLTTKLLVHNKDDGPEPEQPKWGRKRW